MHNYIELLALFAIAAAIIGWEVWSTCEDPEQEEKWLTLLELQTRPDDCVGVVLPIALKGIKAITKKRWLRKWSYRMSYQSYLKMVAEYK